MKDNFLQLPREAKTAILQQAESALNINAIVLEKDIWICWLLDNAFDEIMEKLESLQNEMNAIQSASNFSNTFPRNSL